MTTYSPAKELWIARNNLDATRRGRDEFGALLAQTRDGYVCISGKLGFALVERDSHDGLGLLTSPDLYVTTDRAAADAVCAEYNDRPMIKATGCTAEVVTFRVAVERVLATYDRAITDINYKMSRLTA